MILFRVRIGSFIFTGYKPVKLNKWKERVLGNSILLRQNL